MHGWPGTPAVHGQAGKGSCPECTLEPLLRALACLMKSGSTAPPRPRSLAGQLGFLVGLSKEELFSTEEVQVLCVEKTQGL